MRKTNSARAWASRAVLLVSLILLAVALASCRAKDIVSLAKLDKGDLYVGDKYGNSVMVGNRDELLNALKKAERVKDKAIEESTDRPKFSHMLWSGQEQVYYDWETKRAVVVDSKDKKTVFSVDLHNLLLGVRGLPPPVFEGSGDDPAISSSFAEISKVDIPSAAVFRSGNKAIVMVAAGKKPTGGYTMSLQNVRVGPGGNVELTVRLHPPAGKADDVITYPYLELSLAKYVDVEIVLVSTVDGRERAERVNLAVVEPDQKIVVFKPDRGSLLTERVQMYGFAKWDLGSFTVTVHDGHSVLGSKDVKVTHSLPAGSPAPLWGAFSFTMDLQQATWPSGTVEFAKGSEILARIPVSFGGK